MGIEKAHVTQLRLLKKRLTPDIAREACERVKAAGLRAADRVTALPFPGLGAGRLADIALLAPHSKPWAFRRTRDYTGRLRQGNRRLRFPAGLAALDEHRRIDAAPHVEPRREAHEAR